MRQDSRCDRVGKTGLVQSSKRKDHDHYSADHLDCRIGPALRRGRRLLLEPWTVMCALYRENGMHSRVLPTVHMTHSGKGRRIALLASGLQRFVSILAPLRFHDSPGGFVGMTHYDGCFALQSTQHSGVNRKAAATRVALRCDCTCVG